MKTYWNKRYLDETYIWGLETSNSYNIAEQFFKSIHAKRILVPGCGYGRHTESFARNNFIVTGFDISDEAIKLARSRRDDAVQSLSIDYFIGDLERFVAFDKFDGVYCHNLFHLILTEQRRSAVYNKITRWLRGNGALFISVMSTQDASYGKGNKISEDTFESKPGRGIRYFTPKALEEELETYFHVHHIDEITEPENHGGKKHTHHLLGASCTLKTI